ncbi:CDP-diacylglycerol--serine O-phosphatidyltransferase [Clostridium botulinum]|uniref:CDP-diacylglycerol--serine O-phosphatidyltransferase n=1 Tax=Clostridium botulinum C/D str. DC5 TaxID=1443128 RepID=A0A0A0IF05_CLOBO|nr:CDP-diacylglycerol--serine O-phosphatidyltransferase [Clostridium botulinum]KEI06647.1 CDP-diacylglycerol--serine O-phosphatidyltransferase [Clostridium botulinum C/D str. BKT75002]KEI09559.1 CDP-diacylglycerol--serine O-phosphatidyltransferase [Clostridium botulinum C/D str. BKT2873]KGM93419.1 CDP-diacylglycerol--serine O-phosphatidyltransferase [Clostridium botulinum D str. CCUG 7971]KGM98861.1 CDP-diacylglycerol--serine O-phosphatidyltransferase [Clostridium botulinum C/D str. DC5]KOC468
MIKKAVPNAFTLGNLACGLISLIMTFEDNFSTACIFILLAGVMDRYDGRIARYLDVSSDIGKELDSLADLVSFGVAPSILIFKLYNFINLGIIGYLLVLLFPLSGAYRLARYNCSTFDGTFTGIPITLAGMLLSVYAFVNIETHSNVLVTSILMIILSYLMVSKFKIKKV